NAGYDERLNWARFTEVYSAALPRPGADGNLTDNGKLNGTAQPGQQERLWRGEGDAGVKALEWFQDRMRKRAPIEHALEDDRSKYPLDLAVVNVESVYPRRADKAGDLSQAADDRRQRAYQEDIADSLRDDERERDEARNRWKPKPAEGGGWVVEIRGYTYHHDGPNFVKRALIRNLQRVDEFARDEGKVGKFLAGVPDPVK